MRTCARAHALRFVRSRDWLGDGPIRAPDVLGAFMLDKKIVVTPITALFKADFRNSNYYYVKCKRTRGQNGSENDEAHFIMVETLTSSTFILIGKKVIQAFFWQISSNSHTSNIFNLPLRIVLINFYKG